MTLATKMLEVRDKATFIPVLAIQSAPTNDAERYLLRRAGYSRDGATIIVVHLVSPRVQYDVYSWGDRTMQTAHDHIERHFEQLQDGDVIDVEFLLGEVETPKMSERL